MSYNYVAKEIRHENTKTQKSLKHFSFLVSPFAIL